MRVHGVSVDGTERGPGSKRAGRVLALPSSREAPFQRATPRAATQKPKSACVRPSASPPSSNADAYNKQLLDAYNAAWGDALLTAGGYDMIESNTTFINATPSVGSSSRGGLAEEGQ